MLLIPLRQPGSRVDCLQPHQSHQSLYPLSVYCQSVDLLEFSHHSPATVERQLGVNAVDQVHDLEIVLAFRNGLIVVARAGNAEQLALLDDAQISVPKVNEGPSILK